jgi:hypothetical protein
MPPRWDLGVTADYATNPDIGVLARGIENGIRELTEAAHRRQPGVAGPGGRPAASHS